MKSSLFLLGHIRQSPAKSVAVAIAVARRRCSASARSNRGALPLILSSTIHTAPKHGFYTSALPVKSFRNNKNCNATPTTSTQIQTQKRSHYSFDGPGIFAFSERARSERHSKRLQTWDERGFTVGIGGPVGSGKTALVLALIKRLAAKVDATTDVTAKKPPLAVVTNDIFTQEDAQFLWKNQDVLPSTYIKAVETGGCPHAAIREDVSANLTACEDLTEALRRDNSSETTMPPPLILCESGGDNLAANFSSELADLTLYVIDVAGGDKVPRKGGPGITQSDLLVVNKIDLAEAVGADLGVMRSDADRMRSTSGSGHGGHGNAHDHSHDHGHGHGENDGDDEKASEPESGPTVFASVKNGTSLDEIETFILENYYKATAEK